MLNNEEVYCGSISERYELLIAKEDYEGRIPAALAAIASAHGRRIVDLGAGTGRLSRLLAPAAASVTAVDRAADMLRLAAAKLTASGLTNWRTVVSDIRSLPLEDVSADVVLAGWSLCYIASANRPAWRDDLAQVMEEIRRLIRPGGAAIVLETLGTGNEEPAAPAHLQPYFAALENEYGFRRETIRTDYRFDSPEQAETVCRDFFGDELGDRIAREGTCIVPECTGIWWRKFG